MRACSWIKTVDDFEVEDGAQHIGLISMSQISVRFPLTEKQHPWFGVVSLMAPTDDIIADSDMFLVLVFVYLTPKEGPSIDISQVPRPHFCAAYSSSTTIFSGPAFSHMSHVSTNIPILRPLPSTPLCHVRSTPRQSTCRMG